MIGIQEGYILRKIPFFIFILFFSCLTIVFAGETGSSKPNIVLLIADDMGWLDTGYSGNAVVKTPVLDEMAAKGLRFDAFYASGNVCCPGRYAILTGRTPLRGGMIGNHSAIRPTEVLLPRGLKQAGYRTSYIGKWHIGYGKTAPDAMGFDEAIWTNGGFRLEGRLTTGNGKSIDIQGDGSVAIMNLSIDFIRTQVKNQQPFFVTVAFSSPHRPHIAAPEFKALYKNLPEEEAHYFGQISGIDAALGKLREELRRLNIAEDTVLWFISDNGGTRKPSRDPAGKGKGNIGARTVGLMEWPGHIKQPRRITMPCDQVDVYPTILELSGGRVSGQPVLDGISLVPLVNGQMSDRRKPLGFLDLAVNQADLGKGDFLNETWGIWIDGKYKLVTRPAGKRQPQSLYDIFEDTSEKENLAEKLPAVVDRMQAAFDEWRRSVKISYDGKELPAK